MGSKKTIEGAENVYKAATLWVDRALRTDDSLFTPGKPVWTSQWLDELHQRFLDRPDESSGSFAVKLKRQLEGSPPEVYQLMGEALYAHFLIVWKEGMKWETKKSGVERVLGWGASGLSIPDDLVDGLTPGIAQSMALVLYRPFHIGLIIEFVEQWKEQEPDKRQSLLKDPWAFKEFLMAMRCRSHLLRNNQDTPRAQREALLHLVYPDTFEGTVSIEQKEQIANAKDFAHFVTEEIPDVDRKLEQIRQGLETELGRDFDFYDPDIRKRWGRSKGKNPTNQGAVPSTGNDKTSERYDALKTLADELFLPVDFLENIETLLKDKKQVIFQGPPGTGKTYVAQKLANHLAGSKERVMLVQFHPSYAYEDFVQGFRPASGVNGQVGFKLQGGPLLRAAERAEQEPNANHFLVIDEINRGNLAKVFGELYFLLEYRDYEMELQYSDKGERFSLPENLYIIGTMNTADSSIARVDLALRRRFYFVEFHPNDEPVISNVLRKWLAANSSGMEWVAGVVESANKKLKDDRHAAIGPSYFMKKDLDDDAVERIWKHSVLPYIKECLFGDNSRISEFGDLHKLRHVESTDSGSGQPEDAAAQSAPDDNA